MPGAQRIPPHSKVVRMPLASDHDLPTALSVMTRWEELLTLEDIMPLLIASLSCIHFLSSYPSIRKVINIDNRHEWTCSSKKQIALLVIAESINEFLPFLHNGFVDGIDVLTGITCKFIMQMPYYIRTVVVTYRPSLSTEIVCKGAVTRYTKSVQGFTISKLYI